jgi:cyanate lyase
MIARISAKPEKALREALTGAARIQDQFEAPLTALDDEERTEALGLAARITCYAMVDACGGRWPTDSTVRQIASGLATIGTVAERLRLDEDEIYAYLSRTVLGPERLEDVIPDEPQIARLPVIVAGQALLLLSPEEMGAWDYLDQIESAIEVAKALSTAVLPAAVMLSYLPKPEAAQP